MSVSPATTVSTAQKRSMNVSHNPARMEAPALTSSTRTSAPAPEEHKVSTVRLIWTTATPPVTRLPTSPSASTTASAWTASGATSACVPPATWASAAKGTSTNVCQTPVTPEAPTTASSSPTATAANAVPDIQVNVVTRCSMAAKVDPAEMEGRVLLPVIRLMVSSVNVHLASPARLANMIPGPAGV